MLFHTVQLSNELVTCSHWSNELVDICLVRWPEADDITLTLLEVEDLGAGSLVLHIETLYRPESAGDTFLFWSVAVSDCKVSSSIGWDSKSRDRDVASLLVPTRIVSGRELWDSISIQYLLGFCEMSSLIRLSLFCDKEQLLSKELLVFCDNPQSPFSGTWSFSFDKLSRDTSRDTSLGLHVRGLLNN